MRSTLDTRIALSCATDGDSFPAARALYWYCADHHSGQTSALYSILSTLPYRPGAMERSPDLYGMETEDWIYRELADGRMDPSDVLDWIQGVQRKRSLR